MCHINKEHPEAAWISIILRLAMISLFTAAAVGKFMTGLGMTVSRFESMFKDTWLPLWLVTPYAHAIVFVEILVIAWLLVGIKLRGAWILAALVMVSLAFGMLITGQFATAADNYVYALIACVGLYVSRYDQCVLGFKK